MELLWWIIFSPGVAFFVMKVPGMKLFALLQLQVSVVLDFLSHYNFFSSLAAKNTPFLHWKSTIRIPPTPIKYKP